MNHSMIKLTLCMKWLLLRRAYMMAVSNFPSRLFRACSALYFWFIHDWTRLTDMINPFQSLLITESCARHLRMELRQNPLHGLMSTSRWQCEQYWSRVTACWHLEVKVTWSVVLIVSTNKVRTSRYDFAVERALFRMCDIL